MRQFTFASIIEYSMIESWGRVTSWLRWEWRTTPATGDGWDTWGGEGEERGRMGGRGEDVRRGGVAATLLQTTFSRFSSSLSCLLPVRPWRYSCTMHPYRYS